MHNHRPFPGAFQRVPAWFSPRPRLLLLFFWDFFYLANELKGVLIPFFNEAMSWYAKSLFLARINSSWSRGWDYCRSCDRSFVDRRALEQHWTDSYSHWWCRRCDELFNTQEDLESHNRSSMAHWICPKCDIDYAYEEDLQEHYDENSNHNYCTTCSRDFISPNNLSQVRQGYPKISWPMFITVSIWSMESPICLGISLVSLVETAVISQHGRPCLSILKTAAVPPSTSWTELHECATSGSIMFSLSTNTIWCMIILFRGRRRSDVLAAREHSRCWVHWCSMWKPIPAMKAFIMVRELLARWFILYL